GEEEGGRGGLDVLVSGMHTYAGSRHRLPYRNAVALAGEVAGHLESWLDEYAVRHEHATMRPQGIVSSISGGSDRLAASTAALVRLRLDLRITTEQAPAGVIREVRAAVERLGENLRADLRIEQVAAVPASHTSPD